MAELVVVPLLEALGGGLAAAGTFSAFAFDAVLVAEAYGGYALLAAGVYTLREQQRRAKNAYNAGLRDRYVMQRTATGQRSLVLGRTRVSGPVTFMHSYGDNNTTLAMCIVLAGHECDGIEEIYFNDTAVILDGSGNVVGTKNVEHFSISGTTATFTLGAVGTAGTASAVATYDTGDVTLGVVMSGDGKTLAITGGTAGKIGSVVVTYQPYVVVYTPTRIQDTNTQQTASGSTGTFTVPSNCITTSVAVVGIVGNVQTALSFSRTGNTITYTGATAGQIVHLMYQAGTTYSRARIRKYLGGSGQAADATLISNLPALWTSNHIGVGLTYLVVELDYDPGTFPTGIPNVSAVVRGAKVYDPRTSTTAWSDNPALLMRAYYTHPLGGGRSTGEVNDTAIIAAANVCDGSVTYTVGTHKQTRARYRAATVAAKDRKPQDVLTDLAHAMGGRWVISGNQLVVRAGVYTSPVASMDETWLHSGSPVSMQPRPNRADLTNSITGSFADEEQAFQTISFPSVKAAAYITADGRELQSQIDYPAVTYSGQAQYLAASAIRYNRAGLTVKMSCNMRAYPLEVFDIVSVSLARFGWSAKTFEVLSTGFSVDGLVELVLKEIDSSIWALDAAFLATDYAVKTQLPSPWVLPVPVIGTIASGTSYLLKQADGTISSRIYVPFTAITDNNVLQGGFVDVSYMRAGDPDLTWNTVSVAGDAISAILTGVNDGAVYIIKARTRNRLAEGNWSTQVAHKVVGKTAAPANVSGFALAIVPGALKGTRTPSTEADFDHTVYRYGASFAAGTQVPGTSDANGFIWPWPALGSYTVWAADVDTSGNLGTPVSQTITVDNTIKIGAGNSLASASAALNRDPTCNDPTAWSGPHQAFLTGIAGAPGGTCLTNAAGYSSDELSDAAPIDPTRRYRLTISAARLDTSTSAIMFLGIAWYDAAGVLIVSNVANPPGWNNGSFSYFGLVADNPPPNFTTYSIEFGGSATAQAPINAASARIVALLNYSATPGAVHAITAAGIYDVVDVAAAQATANTAASNATTALGTLATMRSNGYLDASEKPAVIKQYQAIYDEQAGIAAQASAYGVTTERTAYISAFNALVSYLSSLSPAWNDTTSDTLITPAVDQATWAAYYSARQDLLNKIAEVAGTLAVWNSISGTGKPLDNAGKTVDLGGATGVFGARDRDDLPSEYPWGRSLQFKQASSIGLSGSDGTYCTLETLIQFVDDSGGPNVQYAYQGGKTWRRTALRTAGAWGSWTQDLDRNSYTGDLAATRNTVFYQDTDPGSVPDGSIWVSSTKAYQRVSGAWQPYVGNGSVDTTQLASAAATDVTTVTFTAISFNNIA